MIVGATLQGHMDDLLQTIKPYATTRFLKKGAMVLYQGEIPRCAFIVRKGLIRSYAITSAGEERIISLHGRGDIFPLSWIFGETTNTLFYYEATSDVEVVCVPKTDLVQAVTATPHLLSSILKFTINEYTALLMRITALEQSSAAEKIALTLYYLLIRHGIQKKPGLYTIDIKMTQSMLASLVGLTRESTAVNLKLLKKKGIVSYSNFIYIVDKQNLERFVGEDSFKDLALR
ncbi:MAG: Crp/Fnr family transcriptional regulator [Candidatus Saccharimonadales bacterium]